MKRSIILTFILILIFSIGLISCREVPDDTEHQHEYKETVFEPTCQEKGYTVRLCIACGETTTYDFKPYANHTAGEFVVVKEATCNVVGLKEQRCVYCNKTMKSESVALANHVTAWATTKLPTCSKMGTEELKCTICNKTVEARATETTNNHDFELFITPPTDEQDGYTTYKCKNCGHSEVGDYVKLENKEYTAQEIYEKISGATAKVFSYDKNGKQIATGSAFAFASDGRLYTNYHVIKSAYSVKVKFYDGTTYTVSSVLGYNVANDVAAIKIEKTDTEYLKIATEKAKTGDTVYALGNPLGLENIFSTGVISNEGMKANGIDCVAFTAPISPGNSGGPLVNTKGEVIGINSMYIPNGQNLNFAILIEKATSLNLSNPTTVQAIYTAKLQENALDVLANYINCNYNATAGDLPVIAQTTPETETDVGAEYYLIYDSDEEAVFLQMVISQKGQRKYAVEIAIPDTSGIYSIVLYDFEINQNVIEATVNASITAHNYNYFDVLFTVHNYRCDTSDTTAVETLREIMFTMYQGAVAYLDDVLKSSNTGLTTAHFKFN